MRYSLLPALVLGLLLAPGCKKKEAETAPAANTSADVLGKVSIPAGDTSKAFAGKILTHDVTNFTPGDGYGMKFVYQSLKFYNDNTWLAEAVIGQGDDSVACKEHGTWTMDEAKDDHTADMSWKLEHTTCPGRENQNMIRVNVNIEKGEYTISLR